MRALFCLPFLILPIGSLPASGSVILALESDADAAAGSELFFVSYPTFEDLVSDTNGSGTFGGINIASGFSMRGLTYDGQFRLALESDADAAAGSELFFVSYPTFGDLAADANGAGVFGAINVASGFSVRALTYDGQFRLALETDADAAAGSELFFVTYPTFGDLVADTNGSGTFGAINIASGFSAGGLTYDGQFRLALESDADAGAGSELFFVSYPTFGDLVADTNGTSISGAINVAQGFSATGLSWVQDAAPLPPTVPLPSGLPLLLGALGMLVVRRRTQAGTGLQAVTRHAG